MQWEWNKQYESNKLVEGVPIGKLLANDLCAIANREDIPENFNLNSNWICTTRRIGNWTYLLTQNNLTFLDSFNDTDLSEMIKIWGKLYHLSDRSVIRPESTTISYDNIYAPRLSVHLLCKEINKTKILKAHEEFPTITFPSGEKHSISIDDDVNKIIVEQAQITPYTVGISISDEFDRVLSKPNIDIFKDGQRLSYDEVIGIFNNNRREPSDKINSIIQLANNLLVLSSKFVNKGGIRFIDMIDGCSISPIELPVIDDNKDKYADDKIYFANNKNRLIDSILEQNGSIVLSTEGELLVLLPVGNEFPETSHIKAKHVKFRMSENGYFYDVEPIVVVEIENMEDKNKMDNKSSSVVYNMNNDVILENYSNNKDISKRIINLMGLPCDD